LPAEKKKNNDEGFKSPENGGTLTLLQGWMGGRLPELAATDGFQTKRAKVI